jgi:hypothetical protein
MRSSTQGRRRPSEGGVPSGPRGYHRGEAPTLTGTAGAGPLRISGAAAQVAAMTDAMAAGQAEHGSGQDRRASSAQGGDGIGRVRTSPEALIPGWLPGLAATP